VFIPGLDDATFALEIVHQFGPLLASGQDAFAAKFSKGDAGLLAELQDPATGMREGAEKIEVGSVFNDLGAFLYDGSSMYTDAHGTQQARQAELGDLRDLRHDTWKVVDGTWQFSANLIGGGLDDLTVLALGHNDPGVVEPIVHDINVGTHWVASLPDKVEHDWSWVTSFF
jgi:hypothetical protein